MCYGVGRGTKINVTRVCVPYPASMGCGLIVGLRGAWD
jgi:hypothetical protein